MRISSTLRSTFGLVVETWQEAVLVSLFVIPAMWGSLQLTSGATLRAMSLGGSPAELAELSAAYSVPDLLLSLGIWVWTYLAAAVFYQAFENKRRDEATELSLGKLASLSVAFFAIGLLQGAVLLGLYLVLLLVTMSAGMLLPGLGGIGFVAVIVMILAMLPIFIYVYLGLRLIEVFFFKGGGAESIRDSWQAAYMNRWEMLGAIIATWLISLVPVFGSLAVVALLVIPDAIAGNAPITVGPGWSAANAVFTGLYMSFSICLWRALDYSLFEEVHGRAGRQPPGPPAEPTTAPRVAPPEREPMKGPISVDTEVVNLIGLHKSEAAAGEDGADGEAGSDEEEGDDGAVHTSDTPDA